MKINWKSFDDEVLKGVDLCKQINAHGYEAYIVGGCVRDIVLWYKNGQKGDPSIHDVDIATNMPIDELYDNFKCESNNGEAHGTILVKNKGIAFEVTQFRVDGEYTDGRHPDSVKFTKSFRDDTSRRDFTINAMGIDADGNLIDYYGGEQDLDNKVLRTVGSAQDRFSEDALRIIRAIRFAARFDMDIDSDTYEAICNLKANIKGLAMERICAELKKSAEYGVKAFANVINVLVKSGACDSIDDQFINWKDANKITMDRATESGHDTSLNKDWMTSMAILLMCSNNIQNAGKKLRLDTETIKLAQFTDDNLQMLDNLDVNLSKSVKLCTSKYFNRYLEVARCFGYEASDEEINRIENLVDTVLPKQKQVSAELVAKGISGPAFGKELEKRMEQLYREAY